MSWLDKLKDYLDDEEAKGVGPVADGDQYASDVQMSKNRKNVGALRDSDEYEHLMSTVEGRKGMGPVVNPLEYGDMLDEQELKRKGKGVSGMGPIADGDAYGKLIDAERPKPEMPPARPVARNPIPSMTPPSAAPQVDPQAPAPLSDEVLNELAKKEPGLVEQYRERFLKKKKDDAGESDMSLRDMGLLTNVAGNALEGLANSRREDVILKNRFEDMGRAPTIRQQERYKHNQKPLDDYIDAREKKEREDKDDDLKHFNNELKLRDIDKKEALEAQMKDPNSEESKSARQYLQYVIPSIAKDVPGFASASAAQLEKASPKIMEKWKADISQARHQEDMDFKWTQERRAEATRLDNKEIKVKEAEAKQRKAQHKMSTDIRKEVMKDKIFSQADEVDMNLAKVDELLKSPPSGVSDEVLLVSFQKALDPGSVVREGEFARTVEGTSIVNQLVTLRDKLATGKRLTPELRQNIVDSMRAMQRAVRGVKERRLIPYENEIEMYDLPRDIILSGGGSSFGGGSGGSEQTKSAPHGQRVKQGDKTYTWNGSEYVEER